VIKFQIFFLVISVTLLGANSSDLTKIRIIVADERGAPIRAEVMVSTGESWVRFARTNKNGVLERRYKCADSTVFKASSPNHAYYESEEVDCSSLVQIKIRAKPTPDLVSGNGDYPIVGGAAMYATKTIVEHAAISKELTTLVAAVEAAGLVATLSGPGPFTVFAPTDAAFAKLPTATVATLVNAENKGTLLSILNYHVLAGQMTIADIEREAQAGGGQAVLTTVNGGTLLAKMIGKRLVLIDAMGGKSRITSASMIQSNGVIHLIDTVLSPSQEPDNGE